MSFKDGFEAIAQVKASGLKLGEAVSRIEALETSLADLLEVQTGVEKMLVQAETTFTSLETAAAKLSSEWIEFQQLATTLPTMTGNVLTEAEERLASQQRAIALLAERLPQLVEALVEQKLNIIIAHMEARLCDRLRDELKDTRTTLRDAFEVHARGQAAKLEEMKTEIFAEMPRTLFGRRGR